MIRIKTVATVTEQASKASVLLESSDSFLIQSIGTMKNKCYQFQQKVLHLTLPYVLPNLTLPYF